MIELSVQRQFSAAHAIEINGELEPMHGHDWLLTATLTGPLNDDGLVVDFHLIERMLDSIIEPFRNRAFNEVPPFDQTNPTAEQIATYIGTELADRLPTDTTLISLALKEAPGCVATYRP